jgi:hypothetical protein
VRSFLPVVVAFVAVVAVASVIYGTDPNGVSTTSVVSATFPQGTSSVTARNGLTLMLSVNSTRLTAGQTVEVSVEDYNPLSHPVNLSASSGWPLHYLTLGPCGTLNEPIGAAILSGYYTGANASAASALQLYQPAYYPCPAMMAGITSYGFLPKNSSAVMYADCGDGACNTIVVSSTVYSHGYWVGQIGSASFQDFTPGVYTVVAGDEWGALVFLHFTVG